MKYKEELKIDVNKKTTINSDDYYIVDPKIEIKNGFSIYNIIDMENSFIGTDYDKTKHTYIYNSLSVAISLYYDKVFIYNSLIYLRDSGSKKDKFKFNLYSIFNLNTLELSDKSISFSKDENIIKITNNYGRYSFIIETKEFELMHNNYYITTDEIFNNKYNISLKSCWEDDDWECILIKLQCLRFAHKLIYNSELPYLQKPRKK